MAGERVTSGGPITGSLGWVTVLVGAAVTTSFAIPLLILGRQRALWRDTVVTLILSTTLAGCVFGLLFVVTSTTVVVTKGAVPLQFCVTAFSLGIGTVVTFKLAAVCLAVEQYIAVVFCLKHRAIISRWRPVMVAATWGGGVLIAVISITGDALGLETVSEFDRRVFGAGAQHFAPAPLCSWGSLSNAVLIFIDIVIFMLSVISCSLLIHTGLRGVAVERRLNQIAAAAAADADNHVSTAPEDIGCFHIRYKGYKRIVKVLMTLVAVDLLGTGARIVSRWLLPSPLLAFLLHLRVIGFIVDCWTHGLSYPATRDTIRTFFGMRREGDEPVQARGGQLAMQ